MIIKSLTPRLEQIATLVNKGSSVCDVGADHGYLGYFLFTNNIVDFIQLVENKKGPLESLRKTFKDYISDSNIEITLADGLTKLNPRVDTVVISGLGGQTIAKIISDSQKLLTKVEHFILSPHTEPHLVRHLMFKLDYHIEKEFVIKDHQKLYLIISFKKGARAYNLDTIIYGLLKDDDDTNSQEYLEKHKERLEKIKEGLQL